MNKLVIAAAALAAFTAGAAAESPNVENQGRRMTEMQRQAEGDGPRRAFSSVNPDVSIANPTVGNADATGVTNPIGQSGAANEARRLLHGR